MKVLAETGNDDIANVYLAEMRPDFFAEFVESVQPPLPRDEKWVIILSTLFGCPVGCKMCDAGGHFQGNLTKQELFSQIDYLIKKRFPDQLINTKKFKIQFARMGEPSFNPCVLEVLEELPQKYNAPGLIPSFSTIAPNGTDEFFKKLLKIKNKYYPDGQFQMQFSIHTTDEKLRDIIIPIKKWDFKKISEYGKQFYKKGDRKITLNFALASSSPLDPNILIKYFDPEIFLIKLTPLNPTITSKKNNLTNQINSQKKGQELVNSLEKRGYKVILSIGELEENKIGSNCGQYVRKFIENKKKNTKNIKESAYKYQIKKIYG